MKTDRIASVKNYLDIKNVNSIDGEWTCLDGYLSQSEKLEKRNIFMFIRGLLVGREYLDSFINAFANYKPKYDSYPEISENYYSFLGEMIYLNDDIGGNWRRFSFIKEARKKRVKFGERGYYPKLKIKDREDTLEVIHEYPDEVEIEDDVLEMYNILQTVMGYNWESYHSQLNTISNVNIPSKEISEQLKLIFKPQSFNLYTQENEIASFGSEFGDFYKNGEHFTFIRKDLLEKFCEEKNMKLLWYISGERRIDPMTTVITKYLLIGTKQNREKIFNY